MVFISKDINCRLKSDALGIPTEDFEAQKVDADRLYKGYLAVDMPTELSAVLGAAIVGVVVSLIQAVTQIQEQTLSFALKLIGVIITIIFTASWSGGQLLFYTQEIFNKFPTLVR